MLFFISAKLAKNNALLGIYLLIGTIVFCIITHHLNYGEWWYNAVFCFPIGALWSIYEPRLTELLFKNHRGYCALLAVIFASSFYVDEVKPFILFREISCISFSLLIIALSYKITLNSRIFAKIKPSLFEMYLYHGLIMKILLAYPFFINYRFIFCISVLGLTTIFASIMHQLPKQISGLIAKKVRISSSSKE